MKSLTQDRNRLDSLDNLSLFSPAVEPCPLDGVTGAGHEEPDDVGGDPAVGPIREEYCVT